MKDVLVLFYSRYGSVKKLATYIARGINSVESVNARIRTVPNISTVCEKIEPLVPELGFPYVTTNDLKECIGMALGSPSIFGSIASPLKYFLDSTTHDWLSGTLIGKPASLFTSSSSLHGGQEACILSMMIPLLHHGMLILGLPYNDSKLMETQSGCSPYGVSHWDGANNDKDITADEKYLAVLQGKRLALTAMKLARD